MKKEYRIKKNEEFSSLIKEKHSMSCGTFIIYWRKKHMQHARAGISVSKKLGNAVVRNKIKRQLRMMIKESIDLDTYPLDIVVIVRKPFMDADYASNKKLLQKSLKTGKINEYIREVSHE